MEWLTFGVTSQIQDLEQIIHSERCIWVGWGHLIWQATDEKELRTLLGPLTSNPVDSIVPKARYHDGRQWYAFWEKLNKEPTMYISIRRTQHMAELHLPILCFDLIAFNATDGRSNDWHLIYQRTSWRTYVAQSFASFHLSPWCQVAHLERLQVENRPHIMVHKEIEALELFECYPIWW